MTLKRDHRVTALTRRPGDDGGKRDAHPSPNTRGEVTDAPALSKIKP
jgi:hypothetical protein